jgi:predicted nucleotidyltransferase component of viral defense system
VISKEEIQAIAAKKWLGIDIIEKDYVLGWVLAGINHHINTQNSWIFKGGTCLKKCYFETYRFSEDLDFTYRGEIGELSERIYKNTFAEIAQWIYDQSGIELPHQGIEFEIFKNKRNSSSVQGKLSYRGPVRRNVNIARLPRLKIDLILDEPLLLDPILKEVEHPYSDMLQGGKRILAYSYEELFAEKLRALVQRLRPRDLYDVIHLFQQKDLDINSNLLKQTLRKKCDIRAVAFLEIKLIRNHDNHKLLQSEWVTQLRHQMSELPSLKSYMDDLADVLKWIST